MFSAAPLLGNPVPVVHHADGLTDQQMAAFARWTNLSETTFLLTPTTAGADYRPRIWTPGELPFAGHPTLGSAHAWLEGGGVPAGADVIQECGAGLVTVRRGERLAFAAPPLLRSGPVDADDVAGICRALRIEEDAIVDSTWIDNGPGWVGVLLRDADGPVAVEVRVLCPGYGMPEDPVTGILNAGIGQWLAGTRLPTTYVAGQGTALSRAGRVHVGLEGETVWVGGDTRTTITGTVGL